MARRLRDGLAALPLVLILALSGCTSEEKKQQVASAGEQQKDTAQDGSGEDLDYEDMAVEFSECMRENGVEMPDPDDSGRIVIGGDGGPPDFSKMNAAMEACREYNPMENSTQIDSEAEENRREFARCMRESGLPQFPDPVPGQSMLMDESITGDPDFPEAEKKCREVFGEIAGPPGGE